MDLNAYARFLVFLKESKATLAPASGPMVIHMHPRTWRTLMKDKKLGERFPHLFRQHFPRKKTRSMKGK